MGQTATAMTSPDETPLAIAAAAAQAEIARLIVERERIERRIQKLQTIVRGCEDADDPGPTLTYAERAMKVLKLAKRPMNVAELVDALALAGYPVRGPTRRHQVTTLAISLRRSRAIVRTAKGYAPRGAVTRRAKRHGS
jgi:hypothetical protein